MRELLILILCFMEYIHVCYVTNAAPPPVRNFTTITFFADLKTWNEAARICEEQDGKLLDITYYSLFNIMLSFSFEDPWKELPIGNGPTAWISLHRRVTPLGDHFYSKDCQRLSDFQVVYWNTSSPYSVADGDMTSYCVYDRIYVMTSDNGGSTATHGYTRGPCNEPHHFFCMTENGPCTFEEIDGYYGDSSNDFTDNDVIYEYESDDKCKQLCSDSFSVYPFTGLLVTEECWGFSTSATECRLHIIVKPNYFDNLSHRISSATNKLFIRRCFASAVNYNTFDVVADTSTKPDSDCGTPTFMNTSSTSLQVFVYQGEWTWNEAFVTCKQDGRKLLNINDQSDYSAIGQIVEKYSDIQRMDYIWIGLHEPYPLNHTGVRVWSDCGQSKDPNWDPDSQTPSDVSEMSFCVMLDTVTNYWHTSKCNDQHYFICTGSYAANHSYSNGIQYNSESDGSTGSDSSIGSEVSIGPYNVTEASCRDMCSTLTYGGCECWGFAVLDVEPDTVTECYIYFINGSNTNVSTLTESSDEPFILYNKLIWSDIPSVRNGESESSLIPKSCCDVSGMTSECPDNNVPVYSNSVPTTHKVMFVLYTDTRTWNEALSTCDAAGGTLLQVDDVSKRLSLQRYIKTWADDGDLSGDIWIGLFQLHSDDPCSLRWASDCSRPTWTDFDGMTYRGDINNYCTAITGDMKFVKKLCDHKSQFVCEINSGSCDMLNIVFDINCTIGSYGSLFTVPLVTCFADCQSMTNHGTECWAAVKTGPLTCNLMFYVDPDYCKENNIHKKGYDVFFKSCYSASVFGLPLALSSDASIQPKTSCLDSIPDNLSDQLCYTTTTVTTVTSTTTLPTRSMAQPISSTESQTTITTKYVPLATSVSPFTSESSEVSNSLSISERLLFTTKVSSSTYFEPVIIPHTSFNTEELSSPTSISFFTSSETSAASSFLSTSERVSFTTTSALSIISYLDSMLYPSATTEDLFSTNSISSFTTLESSTESLSPSEHLSTTSSISPLTSSDSGVMPHSSLTLEHVSFTYSTTDSFVVETSTVPQLATVSTSTGSATISVSSTQSSTFTTTSLSTTLTPSTSSKVPILQTSSQFIKPLYIMPCLCHSHNKSNMTVNEWTEWLSLSNTVGKQNTSRYRRRLTSVADQRTSSLTIGMVVSSVFIVLALYIITTDIPRIWNSAKYIHGIKSTKKRVKMKYRSL